MNFGKDTITVLIIVGLIILFTEVSPAQSSGTQYVGEWTQIEFGGIKTWNDGKCQMIMLSERQYSLSIVGSNRLKGTYVNIEHGRWYNHNKLKCHVPGEDNFKEMFVRTRLWMVEGQLDVSGTHYIIKATYNSCNFMYCDDPELKKNDFTTKLKIQEDSTLVDFTGNQVTEKDYLFYRKNSLDQMAQDNATEFDRILKESLQIDFNRFMNNYVSVFNQAYKDGARSAFERIKRLYPGITRKELIEEKYLTSVFVNNKYHRCDGLFLLFEVWGDQGKGLMSAILIRENGVWKLFGLSL